MIICKSKSNLESSARQCVEDMDNMEAMSLVAI
jgi:hypothetical protein